MDGCKNQVTVLGLNLTVTCSYSMILEFVYIWILLLIIIRLYNYSLSTTALYCGLYSLHLRGHILYVFIVTELLSRFGHTRCRAVKVYLTVHAQRR